MASSKQSSSLQELRRGDSLTATFSDPAKDGKIRVNVGGLADAPVILVGEKLVVRAERGQIVFYRQPKR